MKKLITRLSIIVAVTALGPFFWWLGGGNCRHPALACLTVMTLILGICVATWPGCVKWED